MVRALAGTYVDAAPGSGQRGSVLRGLVFGLVLAAPLAGRGQTPSDESAPRAQVIRAVERGFFVEADLGFGYFATDVGSAQVGPGAVIGAYVGYDVLPVLNLSVGALAVTAFSTADTPGSDAFFVGPMARAQVALLSSQRDFLWVRVDGGVAVSLPEEVAGESSGELGPVFGGAVVFEHFTKLRHFSLGVSAGALAYAEPDWAVSVQILPLVKYTF